MTELDEAIEFLRRLQPKAAAKPFYEIRAQAGLRTATMRIYDEIGWFGTSAKSFADELAALDVDEIDLRLNSPGGNAWDGVAIFSALRKHKAKVTVTVDGMAASAASVIAMAGDSVRMNRGSQMMVHDAWGLAIGNAKDMADAATRLGKVSDSLADIYAAKAGGTAAEWRDAMAAESWYTAAEAVDAGLADEAVDDVGTAPADDANARFDLSAYAFAYAGRDAAPPPRLPVRPEPPAPPPKTTAVEAARRIHAASNPDKKGAGLMDPAKIREGFGLAPDASDDEVKAAAQAALGLGAAPSAATPPEAGPTPTPAPKTASGVMTIDVSAWDQQQARIKNLEAAEGRRRVEERDQVLAQAVKDGKFPPARTEHWARLWDADAEGTREVVASLAKNVIPVAALGYSTDADGDELDAEFAALFPPARKGA